MDEAASCFKSIIETIGLLWLSMVVASKQSFCLCFSLLTTDGGRKEREDRGILEVLTKLTESKGESDARSITSRGLCYF